MRHANIISGVAVFLVGIATTYFGSRLPYTMEFSPGPGFLPLWLGIILMISSLFVIVADLRNKERGGAFFAPETITCVKVLVLIVAIYLILPVTGFPAGLALITAGGMRLMGKHSWLSCGITVVVTAVCIHYLFGQWLGIPLPEGMLGW
jgi:putative tricarboxylic transport membrane protein